MGDKREDYRGLFVVFEGIDGAGKLRQARMLQEYIQGDSKYTDVVMTHEPWRSAEIKRKLEQDRDSFSDGREMAKLFVEDRFNHTKYLIRPVLNAGGIVLCDRYKMSTCAYQWVQEIDLHELLEMHVDRGLLTPDITFLLDINRETAERRRKGRDRLAEKYEENKTFVDKLINAYQSLAHMANVDENIFGRVVVINGIGSAEEIFDRVRDSFEPVYRSWREKHAPSVSSVSVRARKEKKD